MSDHAYEIEFTERAEHIYRKLYDEAVAQIESDSTEVKCSMFSVIEAAIMGPILEDPLNWDRALSGSLSNVLRITVGSVRICYTVAPQARKIVILSIVERKPGLDKYVRFYQMGASGELADLLQALNIKLPQKFSGESPSIQ
jgi:mRNA-degrading endonuclease RelE of RelBE toxin-antitoxin system